VVVADNGAGVDPTDESAIFQPYRGGRKMEAVSGSSGLGLWIARGLANKMNGDLTYRRQSGQTLFELILPAGDPEHETSSLTTASSVH
jgi:signal transduction histidine kinase